MSKGVYTQYYMNNLRCTADKLFEYVIIIEGVWANRSLLKVMFGKKYMYFYLFRKESNYSEIVRNKQRNDIYKRD